MKCMAAAVVTLKLISAGNYVQDKCGIYCRPSLKDGFCVGMFHFICFFCIRFASF